MNDKLETVAHFRDYAPELFAKVAQPYIGTVCYGCGDAWKTIEQIGEYTNKLSKEWGLMHSECWIKTMQSELQYLPIGTRVKAMAREGVIIGYTLSGYYIFAPDGGYSTPHDQVQQRKIQLQSAKRLVIDEVSPENVKRDSLLWWLDREDDNALILAGGRPVNMLIGKTDIDRVMGENPNKELHDIQDALRIKIGIAVKEFIAELPDNKMSNRYIYNDLLHSVFKAAMHNGHTEMHLNMGKEEFEWWLK